MARDNGHSVSQTSVLPKHHQVYLVLRQQIADGVWTADEPMPAEVQLAEMFGVSRITIRKAMERLTSEGSVQRSRGRGTFARIGSGGSPVGASLSGNFENLMALGLKTRVSVIDLRFVNAPREIAAPMEIEPGTRVQRAVRLRSFEGRPFSHLTTWLPADIGEAITWDDLERTSLLRLIEGTGHRVHSARQTISACLAAPDVAQLLQVEPGEALLAIRRTVFDIDGRAVERIHGLYRPDTYEHEMSFDRSADEACKVWNT